MLGIMQERKHIFLLSIFYFYIILAQECTWLFYNEPCSTLIFKRITLLWCQNKGKNKQKKAPSPFFSFLLLLPFPVCTWCYNIHCIWSFFVFPGGHPRRRNHPSISADLFETHEGTHILQVREREKGVKQRGKK